MARRNQYFFENNTCAQKETVLLHIQTDGMMIVVGWILLFTQYIFVKVELFIISINRINFCHLPFQSKWLYIGTERGNVHIVNIESFILSGYVINWNKAIEL